MEVPNQNQSTSPLTQLINQVGNHLDDPEWLSQVCIKLSVLLFTHNTAMAQAELDETTSAVETIEGEVKLGGKMSVAEAEKRAVMATKNNYGTLKVQGEAIIQIINSCKTRLKVLGVEQTQPEA